MSTAPFPPGFLWGAATSSYQIEGAAGEDGRGESIWDRFANEEGRIADGTSGAVACDHYHRWREDIAIMKSLHLGAYRFSIAWPRVIPAGVGAVNEAGLDFYDRLVDGLLDAGIDPFVTLYHWDLPQALQDRGGWASRETATAFAEYANVVSRRLGDRVATWVTHNEPWCISHHGHEDGEHAPGIQDPPTALAAAHHVLLSHGWAARAIRENVPEAPVGIVLNLTPASPATDRAEDRDAARWMDGFFNRWFLDPLYHARYPEDAVADRIARGHLPSSGMPFVETGDLEAIAQKLDFLGINYYGRAVMRMNEGGRPESVPMAPKDELTDMGWEVYPDGLHDLLVRVNRDYAPSPIYITENGAAYADGPDADGRVSDPRRIDFHRGHLRAIHRAIADGVPVAGYFAWSLLDNFEWAHGYKKRFGLVWVDHDTQTRIPKESAAWYRDTVVANAVVNGSL
ncbi:MAG: beta-glucosidase [Gemmatimonadetes bacterium]|nr:beta-glucosidase [Gemmatimonadota bacterium]